MVSRRRSRRKSPVAHGPRYDTYVALLLNTTVFRAAMPSMRVGPWKELLSDPTKIAPLNGSQPYAPKLSLASMRRASSTPSALTAASMSAPSSRAWPPTARCSSRSSIHFTGRPRSIDAAITATSSRCTPFFRPNPPPTSSASTRIFSIGTLTCAGSSTRIMCGDCVDAWMVRCSAPGSYDAMRPRVSIGTGWWRCTQMLARTTRSALANAPSTSPSTISLRNATLSSSSSNNGGFDGSNASS